MKHAFKIVLALCLLASSVNAATIWGNSAQLNVAGSVSDCSGAGAPAGTNGKAVSLLLPTWANGAEIAVSGTFVATWGTAASTDGVTYQTQGGQSSSTFGAATGSTAVGSLLTFGVNSRYVCVLLTAYTSGSVGVTIEPRAFAPAFVALGTGGGTQILMAGTSSSLAQGAANSSAVALLTVQAAQIGINSTPAVNTQASAAVAAGSATVRHMAAHCSGSINTIAAQPAISLNLRDGATGAGTILWSAVTTCALGASCVLDSGPLNIIGTAATAMTCEWSGIPAVGNFEIANLEYKNAG